MATLPTIDSQSRAGLYHSLTSSNWFISSSWPNWGSFKLSWVLQNTYIFRKGNIFDYRNMWSLREGLENRWFPQLNGGGHNWFTPFHTFKKIWFAPSPCPSFTPKSASSWPEWVWVASVPAASLASLASLAPPLRRDLVLQSRDLVLQKPQRQHLNKRVSITYYFRGKWPDTFIQPK